MKLELRATIVDDGLLEVSVDIDPFSDLLRRSLERFAVTVSKFKESRGLMVMTFRSHRKGSRFDPGRDYNFVLLGSFAPIINHS